MDIRDDGGRVCKFGFFLFHALMMKDENDHSREKRGSSAVGHNLEAVNGGTGERLRIIVLKWSLTILLMVVPVLMVWR